MPQSLRSCASTNSCNKSIIKLKIRIGSIYRIRNKARRLNQQLSFVGEDLGTHKNHQDELSLEVRPSWLPMISQHGG